MRIVSWNVNGLRACLGKGFMQFFNECGADIFCIQETKLQQGDAVLELPGYHEYWNDAERKGYSGTAVFTRRAPISAEYGIGTDEREGRTVTLEYEDFYLVNVYVPNAGEGLKRLAFRMQWDDALRAYLSALDQKKPVVVCGDFNVAHEEIDLKNPASNHQNAGFTDEEREDFSRLLQAGFADTFRFLYPDARDRYTYWSYRTAARGRNAGWRIDYACVSRRLLDKLGDAVIYSDVTGSDHCPIGIEIF